MKHSSSIIFNRLVISCFGIALCLLLISPSFADRAVPGSSMALAKLQVTLVKKNSKMVSTNIGEQFAINSATLIVGENGEQVPIQRLLVPCDVNLTYTTLVGGHNRLVRRIEVLNTHEHATNKMWEKPQ